MHAVMFSRYNQHACHHVFKNLCRRGGQLFIHSPSVRVGIPHAPTQLRLAHTHKRIEIDIEIDFPVRGTAKPVSPPPQPPICIYSIYMHIYTARATHVYHNMDTLWGRG